MKALKLIVPVFAFSAYALPVRERSVDYVGDTSSDVDGPLSPYYPLDTILEENNNYYEADSDYNEGYYQEDENNDLKNFGRSEGHNAQESGGENLSAHPYYFDGDDENDSDDAENGDGPVEEIDSETYNALGAARLAGSSNNIASYQIEDDEVSEPETDIDNASTSYAQLYYNDETKPAWPHNENEIKEEELEAYLRFKSDYFREREIKKFESGKEQEIPDLVRLFKQEKIRKEFEEKSRMSRIALESQARQKAEREVAKEESPKRGFWSFWRN